MADYVWFITGASSGFGKSITLEALKRGHKVIASARSTSRLGELKEAGAFVMEVDVTSDDETLASKLAEANAVYGKITHVVNAAGYILEGAIEESSNKEIFDTFNTNVFGSFNIARAATKHLRAAAASASGGRNTALANFGSLASWASSAGAAAYCSTKFAVTGLTEGLADELKPFGIDVCVIEPGYTRTGFLVRGSGGPDHRMTTARRLSAYDGTAVAATRDALEMYNGKQPGDVDRCAVAIVDVLTKQGVAEGREVPLRLVTGSDTLAAVRDKCESTLKLVAEWEEVTNSADTTPQPPPTRSSPRRAEPAIHLQPRRRQPRPALPMSPSPPPTPTPPPAAIPAPDPDPPPTRPSLAGPTHYRRVSSAYLASLVSPSHEEFRHIAEIQAQREADLRRRSREIRRRLSDAPTTTTTTSATHNSEGGRGSRLLDRLGLGHLRRISQGGDEAKAATVIQRNYRGYRARREMRGLGLDASTRWVHAVREAQWREMTRPRGGDEVEEVVSPGEGGRPARRQWRKVATIARRAGGDVDGSSSSSSSSSSSDSSGEERRRREEAKERRRRKARMMGLQYFLEMVDLKHRYGANLRVYHDEWKRAETNENFFYWLDHGEGRTLDIEACPRERLDREQVRYLSREERQYYLVNVDEEGRLCWAKNGARIDTTEKWKDSVHGIVPADDDTTPAFQPPADDTGTRLLGEGSSDSDSDSSSSSSSSSDSSTDSETAAQAIHYATPSLDAAKGVKKIKHVTVATLFDKLLRKSVRRNTWIFVVDTSFRLYVGIKNSGAFQHSSFLQGSRISAAGLIKIRDGKLTSLSPLSGHYRPPASNFRSFLKSLREEGVDMKHVTISKSYAVLVGLETYIKIHKKGKEAMGKLKRAKERCLYICSSATPASSALNSSLTTINAFPSKFNPHLARFASALAGPNPTPQIRSIGLASTISRSPVSNNSPRSVNGATRGASLESPLVKPSSLTARVNLNLVPSRTMRSRSRFHTLSSKLATLRPSALTRRGCAAARIWAPTVGSEKSRALWYIM
ncbi:hypothetical protein QBC39DRAFT_389218 [Podospora conica]|nr:hypothetical protein QBC39DRAFT_389218 [Schizothecium conicum]